MNLLEEKFSMSKNNFDFIRFVAAFMVFFDHSFVIFTGKPMTFDPVHPIFHISIGALGVNVFFTLSGFLIASSYFNSKNVLVFYIKRILRILPALIFVVLLSVIILGLFFSELIFTDFMVHPTTWQYLQNTFIFRTYYYLPGVFTNNILNSSVNGSLWTIPYEFFCYLILPFFLTFPFLKKTIGLIIFYLLVLFAFLFFQDYLYQFTVPFLGITMKSFVIPFLYFFSGVVFYHLRSYLSFSYLQTIIFSAIIIAVAFEFLPRIFLSSCLIYFVLLFGFSKKMKFQNFGKFGDFSYGLYLFAFPIQQVVSGTFSPNLPFIFKMFSAFGICLIFAISSWYLVEKPSLRLKKLKFLN